MTSAHAQTQFPTRRTDRSASFSEEVVLLQGHRVLFDHEIGLTPVRIVKEVRRDRDRPRPR